MPKNSGDPQRLTVEGLKAYMAGLAWTIKFCDTEIAKGGDPAYIAEQTATRDRAIREYQELSALLIRKLRE